jgi:hypothetical protein
MDLVIHEFIHNSYIHIPHKNNFADTLDFLCRDVLNRILEFRYARKRERV